MRRGIFSRRPTGRDRTLQGGVRLIWDPPPPLVSCPIAPLGGAPPYDDSNPKALSVANIKSQKKRILTNEKARLRNKAVKSALRTHVRKFREAVEAGDVEKAQEAARVACRALDRAAAKGVIHRNQAANRKSAIATKAAAL